MMKNYLKSFSLLMLLCLGIQAKAVTTLSFNSLSTLDSVRVDNLTTNSSVTIKSPFDIALDGSSTLTTIKQIGTEEDGAGNTLVYPNPFNNEVFLEHFQQTKGDVNISVCDISGKVVANFNRSLEQGVHRLNFKPSTPGMYLVKVVDKTVSCSSKLFCLQGGANSPKIEYEGVIENAISKPNYAKSTTDNSLAGIASTGDILRFSGFSLGNVTTLYDLASTSKSYTFTFGARNFNIKNYYLLASKPCLVDIMFSVTDAKNKGIDYLSNSDFTVSEDNATASPTETFRFVRKMQQLPAKIKTVLLLDISTSVGADIETIKAAATKFVQSIYDKQEVAIYTFSDAPVLLQNFTTDKTILQNAIKGITLGFPSTNLYGSTVTALAKWTDIYSLTGLVQGSLVLFTDGSDTQGSSMLSDVTLARGDKRIYVIGLGSEINPTALNQIANPGPYFPIAKATELDAVFASIQSDIVQFANSFYWLNYMTPKRTGTHSLKVEVKNNTNTDALTSYLNGNFSALGFSSVTSGVFINKEDTRLYGLDTIRCFSSATGYTFAYDKNGNNQYGKDSLVLTPTTYWANKPPVYSWTNSKSATCMLQPSVYSLATLFSTVTKGDTAIVNIKDEANGYSKNVVLVICPDFAELTTAIPKNASYTTVTLGGEVTNIGRTDLTARGVCYATTASPTIANSKIAIGLGKGVFETPVTGLDKATKYYARAYATNTAGTAYGSEQTFTTLANLPVITATTAITNKTATTATCWGVISSDEGAAVTARGVCWSTSPSPTTTDSKTTDGSGTGGFTSAITGLVGGVTYYVRAYATNSIGTAYGTEVSFSTIPAITTNAISSISATSATCGGNVSTIGGTTVTARGVCWSNSPNPTIYYQKTIDGKGAGVFTSAITGLVGGTTYYVRAYATNNFGTSYGDQLSFSTIPAITTTAISDITVTTATCGGNVTAIGGAAVTARGVCWSITPSPTIALTTKTSDGTGIGPFTSAITGLVGSTTYYVRAYATNSIGTAYGPEVSFGTTPTVTTTAISVITVTAATCGGNVTAIGGAAVTGRGVCWSTTTSPTITLTTKTSDGTGAGAFTSAITGLVGSTTYYVRAYATNSIGTAYGNEVRFTTIPSPSSYAIGVSYLGGKIAYLDASGIHGFVCALADQSTGVSSCGWNSGGGGGYVKKTTGATNTVLETTGVYGISKSGGRKNTDLICSIQYYDGTYAASLCAALTNGGAVAGDWYLPSKGELNQLYVNKALLGGFATGAYLTGIYWSSSEYDFGNAWYQLFSNGIQEWNSGVPTNESNLFHVRAVRAF